MQRNPVPLTIRKLRHKTILPHRRFRIQRLAAVRLMNCESTQCTLVHSDSV